MVDEAAVLIAFAICVVLPSTLVYLAVGYPKRKWLFWTTACLVNPGLLLLPFLELFSATHKLENLVRGVYGTAMLTSGPGGLLVSALCGGFEGNFPADKNWSYFIILLITLFGQWVGIWFLGRRMLRDGHKALGTRGVILGFIFFGMFVIGLVHGLFFALTHS